MAALQHMIDTEATPDDLLLHAQSGRMSEHLVRVDNLLKLMRQRGWKKSDLARHCGKSPQQVGSWFAKGESARNIAEGLARDIETRLQLAPYSLDDRAGLHAVAEPPPRWGASTGSAPSITNRPRDMPVLIWNDLPTMLTTDNQALKTRAPHLETFAAGSSRCKFVQMPDDSMAPEIAHGDHVLFDPEEAPHAGDVVLVRAGMEYFVRTFRPRTAFVFDAAPVNPNFQPLSSAQDGAEVVAVMVEHRRYRKTT